MKKGLPTPSQDNFDSLEVKPVEGRRAFRQFIRLPWSIYSEDPAWVPPLLIERRQHLSPRNPYFGHVRFRSWIAYLGGKPIGRISAQVDSLHIERYQDATGFFGMLEAQDQPEIFQALLDTAETWLRDQGMRRVLGPFNLSINQECGLLVQGYDRPPFLMMGHSRLYYAHAVEACGYTKEKDLLAYVVKTNFTPPPMMTSLKSRATGQVRIRPMRMSHYGEDVNILRDIQEDAWSENWGFIPFTDAEFKHLGKDLKMLVDENFVQIAEVDGLPAAMIVVLPNINEIIRDLDGRLLPWGWLRLLWRLKVRYPKTARVPLMGVRKRYRDSILGAALAFMLIESVRDYGIRRGIKEVEMSWILEDNTGMRNIIESLGGIAHKRYRIYGKDLN